MFWIREFHANILSAGSPIYKGHLFSKSTSSQSGQMKEVPGTAGGSSAIFSPSSVIKLSNVS